MNSSAVLPDCNGYASFSQATECVMGSSIGYTRAMLKANGLSASLMSVPNNDSAIMPDINCGTDGTAGCAPMAAGDQWSTYYFFQQMTDLFTGGTVAEKAATYAYSHNSGVGAFTLDKSQLSTSWTALTVDPNGPTKFFFSDAGNPANATMQITCALNNVTLSHAPSFTLNGATYPASGDGLLGVGLVMGWQTSTMQAGQCSIAEGASTNHDHIMMNGWAGPSGSGGNGQFVEMQPDVAFNSLPACAPALAAATTALLANNAPTSVCPYP